MFDDPGCLDAEEDDIPTQILDSSDDEEDADNLEPTTSSIEDLQIALDFIQAVKNASLDNGDLDDETLERLRDPSTEPLDISDPAHRYSLDNFLATTNASEETYNAICDAYIRRHPENELLSHAAIKKKVAEWSGVVPIRSQMCPKTCMAYTGPFSEHDNCRFCGLSRYDVNGVARVFHTIPLGPQLQALFRNAKSAKDMHYRREKTQESWRTSTKTVI
jgi:hypothetical protein